MKNYNAWTIIFLFCIMLATSAFANTSSILRVKNTPLPFNNRMTFGELLDNYKYISNPQWSELQDNSGRTFIQYRARYADNSEIAQIIWSDLNHPTKDQQWMDNIGRIFGNYLNESGFGLNLVARFMQNLEINRYTPTFIGLEFAGRTNPISQEGIGRTFDYIYNGRPIPFGRIDDSAKKMIRYLLARFAFHHINPSQRVWATRFFFARKLPR